MSAQTDFNDLLTAVLKYKLPTYTESKALLYWFLFNIFRLDEIEARDSICDKTNDKGIDGLWVDDDTEEIFLFQSTYTDKLANTLGDKELREFVGSAKWLADSENVKRLLGSAANAELKALLTRLQVASKLEKGYQLKLVFVSARVLDSNGREYLKTLEGQGPHLDLWDRPRLISHYKNLERRTRVPGKFRFKRLDRGWSDIRWFETPRNLRTRDGYCFDDRHR